MAFKDIVNESTLNSMEAKDCFPPESEQDSDSFIDFGLEIHAHAADKEILSEERIPLKELKNSNLICLVSNESSIESLLHTQQHTTTFIDSLRRSISLAPETESAAIEEKKLYENTFAFCLGISAIILIAAFLITYVPVIMNVPYADAVIAADADSAELLGNPTFINSMLVAATVCGMSFGNVLLEGFVLIKYWWNSGRSNANMVTHHEQQGQLHYSRYGMKELAVILRAIALIIIFEECVYLLAFLPNLSLSPTAGILLSTERIHQCIFAYFMLMIHITDRKASPMIFIVIAVVSSIVVSVVFTSSLLMRVYISDITKSVIFLLHVSVILLAAIIPARHLLIRVWRALHLFTFPTANDSKFTSLLVTAILLQMLRHFFGTRQILSGSRRFKETPHDKYVLTESSALVSIFTFVLAIIVCIDYPARMAQLEATRATEQALFAFERQRLVVEKKKQDRVLDRIIPDTQRTEIMEDCDRFVFYRDFTGGVHFYKKSDVATGMLFVDPVSSRPSGQ